MKSGLERLNQLNDTKNKFGEIQSLDTGIEKWNAQEVSTESDPIDDPGIGEKYVIRKFDFAFNPETIKAIKDKRLKAPTKQELFNSVWPQLKIRLWGDGLYAVEEADLPPKMKIGKKKFSVVIVCQLARNRGFMGKHKSLNEYLKNA